METKKYILKYEIYLIDSEPLLDKEIKISNCENELQAKFRLEDYLKRKYVNFKSLVVKSCKEKFDLEDAFKFSQTSEFADIFNKLFGGKL